MPNPTRGALAGVVRPGTFITAVLLFAAVAAACSSAQATSSAVPTETVLASIATPAGSGSQAPGATSVAGSTATTTAAPTAAPTAATTAAPTTAPVHTAKPTPVPTPLPSLAVGLCKASQLKLQITAWIGNGSADSYAHVTATNKSGVVCNMRGLSEARVADGHGRIIADAGSGAAKVSSSDTVYPLTPGGTVSTILDWANWCKSAPAQKVTVAMIEPFGLGGFVAPSAGDAPIPNCYAPSAPSTVTSEAWAP